MAVVRALCLEHNLQYLGEMGEYELGEGMQGEKALAVEQRRVCSSADRSVVLCEILSSDIIPLAEEMPSQRGTLWTQEVHHLARRHFRRAKLYQKKLLGVRIDAELRPEELCCSCMATQRWVHFRELDVSSVHEGEGCLP